MAPNDEAQYVRQADDTHRHTYLYLHTYIHINVHTHIGLKYIHVMNSLIMFVINDENSRNDFGLTGAKIVGYASSVENSWVRHWASHECVATLLS